MQKIFIETHGCSANLSDTESMAGLLSRAGYGITNDLSKSDVVIYNSCTVKGEDNSAKEINAVMNYHPYKKYVIAGCLTHEMISFMRDFHPDASLVNTHNMGRIVEVVDEAVSGNRVELLSRERATKLLMPKIRKNHVIGIVPILNGCKSHCSFCSVWMIKGPLLSYPEEEIIGEARNCIRDGCSEIWITSQDNGAYSMDKAGKSTLPSLIRNICAIDGEFMVRIGMMNPQHVLPDVDDYIDSFRHPKVFKFLHIPVQSGSDEILRLMERGYTVDDFRKVISKFRSAIPEISISTDIICGFPTETEVQSEDTIKLVEEIGFDVINISRFAARQNTRAERMEQLHGRVIKERSRKVTEAYIRSAEKRNSRWIGWEGSVIVDENGKDNTFVGRNFAYKPVILKGNYKLGARVNVKITGSTAYDLRGEAI
ncbi:tRNA (N(6)-L-threonylcarbamoyladenosine(37)-C(2))-methylthiotransferase [Candidatus Woesearchaeota archaeon]|nr:tRNA (N(6)-L-threonylcarbamoyladenosine(37)-C(2))-methylthiotransferase [Candidatus Woesearchaeota archaeon]